MRLGAFDAVLAAAAQEADVQALVSADVAFGDVAELHHLTPDHPALAELFR
jgi:predicted nucleic acid-binding protein